MNDEEAELVLRFLAAALPQSSVADQASAEVICRTDTASARARATRARSTLAGAGRVPRQAFVSGRLADEPRSSRTFMPLQRDRNVAGATLLASPLKGRANRT